MHQIRSGPPRGGRPLHHSTVITILDADRNRNQRIMSGGEVLSSPKGKFQFA